MHRTRSLPGLLAAALLVAFAAGCGGSGPQPPVVVVASNGPIAPPAPGTAQFLVTVPVPAPAAASRRRPSFAAPAGTASVSVTLQSVNGAAPASATPVVANLAAGAAGCTTAATQIVCSVNAPAPPGSDVFLVKTFAAANGQGTATGAGYATVQATAGTTQVQTVINGTVSTIALSVPQPIPAGAATTTALVVVAKDASGATILGSYTNPITLTDTDASAQTKLSTLTVPDSTTATGISLTYAGGAMTTAAVISASAAGVNSASVRSANFLPNEDYPTTNHTTSYSVNGSETVQFPGSAPQSFPLSLTDDVTLTNGASFNGHNNVVQDQSSVNSQPPTNASYYAWSVGPTASQFEYLGLSGSETSPSGSESQQIICQPPYQATWIVPLPQSWNIYAGTGPCTETDSTNSTGGAAQTTKVNNADGSYTESLIGYTPNGQYQQNVTVNADGSATRTINQPSGNGGSSVLIIGTPAPGASTIPVQYETSAGYLASPLPSPSPTTIPNWYAAAGVPNGTVPSPLQTETMTNKGTASLPASCNVAQSIIGTSPITEVVEQFTIFDPLIQYSKIETDYYLANGIGTVCAVETLAGYDFTFAAPFTTSSSVSVTATETLSVTATSLQAAYRRTASFAQALPSAEMGLVAVAQERERDQLRAMRNGCVSPVCSARKAQSNLLRQH